MKIIVLFAIVFVALIASGNADESPAGVGAGVGAGAENAPAPCDSGHRRHRHHRHHNHGRHNQDANDKLPEHSSDGAQQQDQPRPILGALANPKQI